MLLLRFLICAKCIVPRLRVLPGAIYVYKSEVYIHGNTVFAGNSAENNGGEVFLDFRQTNLMI